MKQKEEEMYFRGSSDNGGGGRPSTKRWLRSQTTPGETRYLSEDVQAVGTPQIREGHLRAFALDAESSTPRTAGSFLPQQRMEETQSAPSYKALVALAALGWYLALAFSRSFWR